MPFIVATLGMGETHHPRSKVAVMPQCNKHIVTETDGKLRIKDITDTLALGIAESNFSYDPEDNPEYYLSDPTTLE